MLSRMSHPQRCGLSTLTGKVLHSSHRHLRAASSVSTDYSNDETDILGTVEPSTPSYLELKPSEYEVEALYNFFRDKKNVLVITGAGMSTSSGVPDYRGPLGSYKLGALVNNDFYFIFIFISIFLSVTSDV